MIIKQISIFVENRPGRLAEVVGIIGEAGIDIRALSIADTSDFGILRLIVNNPDAAVESLKKADITVTLTDVIAVAVDDTPGAFAGVMQAISGAGITVEYMYAFLGRDKSRAFVIMRIENAQEAVRVLQENGVRLLSSQEVYNM